MSKNKIIFLFIFLSLAYNLFLFSDYMEIDVYFKKNIDSFCDITFGSDKIVISFLKKYIVYNLLGEEIKKVEKLKKSSSRKILLMDDKIVNILGDKHLLQVFRDCKILKEIDLKEKGVLIIYSCNEISDSTIVLLTDIFEESDGEKFFHHYLIKMNVNTKKISKISDFGREKSSLDYIFTQDPINEKLSHIIIGKKEFVIIEKDSIYIRDFNNKLLMKRKIKFETVAIDEDIKKYYDKKKPFIMKFIYPENSPGIYKLYPLSGGYYIIDTWVEKAKRIKNKNLKQFTLYYYDCEKDVFSKLLTKYNPDNFKQIKNNKIAIYSDSELIIGEIIIKDDE